MKQPVLIIMAAGLGSRYGGLKQIDPIDRNGHLIIDYSIFDAVKAGFKEVICIIKRDMEEDFRRIIGDRISKRVSVKYVYQDNTYLPEGFSLPKGRVKPWGTGHALMSCIGTADGPFAVINADDYYGSAAFKLIYDYLEGLGMDENRYAMCGYKLKNTLTDYGHVARGVCTVSEEGKLLDIVEHTHIIKTEKGAAYTEDDGQTWSDISPERVVSMNMWGFSNEFLYELRDRFPAFLEEHVKTNPLKCEYFLPSVVDQLLKEGKIQVDVLHTDDKWYGVTYKEDKEMVVNAINKLIKSGKYPEELWR